MAGGHKPHARGTCRPWLVTCAAERIDAPAVVCYGACLDGFSSRFASSSWRPLPLRQRAGCLALIHPGKLPWQWLFLLCPFIGFSDYENPLPNFGAAIKIKQYHYPDGGLSAASPN